MIIKNQIRCKLCGDIIESKHRHDFRWCSCNHTAVDGGHDYLRRCGDAGTWEDLSIIVPDPGPLLYGIRLWDPGTPAFCSFSKLYIGTADDLRKSADEMDGSSTYYETARAIREYLGGNHSATHNIAYCEIPILEEARFIDSAIISLGEHSWEHLNAWQCPYNLHCDDVVVYQIIVQYEGKFYRCLRAWFTNLCYESTVGTMSKLSDGFWGNTGVLEVIRYPDGGFLVSNRLYLVEKEYDSAAEAQADSIEKAAIDFSPFCDEMFGDG